MQEQLGKNERKSSIGLCVNLKKFPTTFIEYSFPLTKKGNEAVVVFVDKLTKMIKIEPTTINCTAKDTTKI